MVRILHSGYWRPCAAFDVSRLSSRKRGPRLASQQENGSKVVGVVDILGRLSAPSPGSAFERLRGGKFVEERTVVDTALSLAIGF